MSNPRQQVEEVNEYQQTWDSRRELDFISAGVARMIFLRLPSSVRLRFYFSFLPFSTLFYPSLDRSCQLFRRWPRKRTYESWRTTPKAEKTTRYMNVCDLVNFRHTENHLYRNYFCTNGRTLIHKYSANLKYIYLIQTSYFQFYWAYIRLKFVKSVIC